MLAPSQPPSPSYTELATSLARTSLGPEGLLRLKVNGQSMWPALRPGDVVLLQPVQPENLRRGDMLTLQTPSGLLTHRLIRKSLSEVQTKGDACPLPDAPLPFDAIVGRVIQVEREGGLLFDLTSRRWQRVNALAARISSLEGSLLSQLGRFEPQVLRAKQPRGTSWLVRGLHVPFRLCLFLLQFVFEHR